MGNTIERTDLEQHCVACGGNVAIHQVFEVGALSEVEEDGSVSAILRLMGQRFDHDCRPQTPRVPFTAEDQRGLLDLVPAVEPAVPPWQPAEPGEEEENPDEEEARNAALLARVLGEVAEQNAHLPTLSSPS